MTRRCFTPKFTSQWKLRLRWSGAENTSEPRIDLIWHTVSPSWYPPMRRSTRHYMMRSRSATNLYKDESHSTTELEALTKFPQLPKPQVSQGQVTTPQLNWSLPASPSGSQTHKNDHDHLGFQRTKSNKFFKGMDWEIKSFWWKCRSRSTLPSSRRTRCLSG